MSTLRSMMAIPRQPFVIIRSRCDIGLAAEYPCRVCRDRQRLANAWCVIAYPIFERLNSANTWPNILSLTLIILYKPDI